MVDPRPCVAKIQPHAKGGLETVLVITAKVAGKPQRIVIPFSVRVGRSLKMAPEDPNDNRMVLWGLRRLGSTVWTVEPSIITPMGLHVFVTLIEVPDPAPFVLGKPTA